MAKTSGGSGEEAGGSARARPQLKQDRLVESIVPDPNQPPSVITLTGFLGNGAQQGDWRLYLSANLDEYVEFSESDVVHHQPISQERSPLGGTTVWVRSGTTLRHTCVESRQVQADFLQGGITSEFMRSTRLSALRGAAVMGTGWGCTRNYVCSTNPHIPACQLRSEACVSFGCGPQTGLLCPSVDCHL